MLYLFINSWAFGCVAGASILEINRPRKMIHPISYKHFDSMVYKNFITIDTKLNRINAVPSMTKETSRKKTNKQDKKG